MNFLIEFTLFAKTSGGDWRGISECQALLRSHLIFFIPARDHLEEALVGVGDLVRATGRIEFGRARIVARI